MAHQDIKPSNILIDPQTFKIWLIDFGLSAYYENIDHVVVESAAGTPLYMAPELLQTLYRPHDPISSDLWSAGIVFFELLLGFQPFDHCDTKEELLEEILRGYDYSEFSHQSQRILERLLEVNSSERANISEAMNLVASIGKPPQDPPLMSGRRWRSRSLGTTVQKKKSLKFDTLQ